MKNKGRTGEVNKVTLFVTRTSCIPDFQRRPSSLFCGNSIFWLSSFEQKGRRISPQFSFILNEIVGVVFKSFAMTYESFSRAFWRNKIIILFGSTLENFVSQFIRTVKRKVLTASKRRSAKDRSWNRD